jgi:hypothetical protein
MAEEKEKEEFNEKALAPASAVFAINSAGTSKSLPTSRFPEREMPS